MLASYAADDATDDAKMTKITKKRKPVIDLFKTCYSPMNPVSR